MLRGKQATKNQLTRKTPEIKVDFARYKALADSGDKIRVTEQTYYRWKKTFAGLRVDQAKRREAIDQVRVVFGRKRVSEGWACPVIAQSRNTQRR